MKILIILLILTVLTKFGHAASSVIVEVEGHACYAKGDTIERTELQALNNAIANAGQVAAQHIVKQAGLTGTSSGTELSFFYIQAPVRGLQELGKIKYRNSKRQRCIRVIVKAEIIPDHKHGARINVLAGNKGPLDVIVRTERQIFVHGDKVSFTVIGNKNFFGSIVYTDAAGNIIQIIPNEFQKVTRFAGGTEYKFPSEGNFSMNVEPPYGTERITVYAATVPLSELSEIVPTGGVASDVSTSDFDSDRNSPADKKTRRVVEYVEKTVTLETRQE